MQQGPTLLLVALMLLTLVRSFQGKKVVGITKGSTAFVMMAQQAPQHLIMGSGSASRRAILSAAGYTFEVCKADIDERGLGDRSSGDKARELVLLLGNAKADAIIKANADRKEGVLLTADQVVVCRNRILEKPLDESEAREYMGWYGEHPCSTVGSIVLTDLATGRRVSGIDSCKISFNPIPPDVVSSLIEEGEVFYCAGGLMIEHPKVQPYIREVQGSMESVMGLCPTLLSSLLKQLEALRIILDNTER